MVNFRFSRCVIVAALLLLGCVSLYAREHSAELIQKKYTLYFRVNKSNIDPAYMGNAHAISTMLEDIRTTLEVSGSVPGDIMVYASTSPEGPRYLNERLAVERAKTIRDFLLENFPQFDTDQITVESRIDDWAGLNLAVRRDSTLKHRDKILAILNNPAITNKDAALKKNPEVYEVIRHGLLDNLRFASIDITVVRTATNIDVFVTQVSEFILSPDFANFTADGDSVAVARYTKTIPDDLLPEVASSAAWVNNLSVTADSTIYSVEPNYSKYPRTTSLDFSIYDKVHTLTVNQEGREPELTLTSASELSMTSEGGQETITYEVNVTDGDSVVVKSNSQYVRVLSYDNGKAVIEVDENTVKEQRNDQIEIIYEGKTQIVSLSQEAASPKPFYMAAKSNMLYDLALVPNGGVEFYLGKNFSVAGNWMYSWWKSDKVYWYWRTYGGDVAVRYWFGKPSKEKPLQGHHAGLYGQLITYDFEVGGRGFLADRWSWTVGLEYGYSLPIASRLNIDFTIGAGYHTGQFYEYLPIDGHYVWQATKNRRYLGPTKAEISLVWLLGRGNENAGKGGKK